MDIHDQGMKGRQDIDIDIHDQGMKGRQNLTVQNRKIKVRPFHSFMVFNSTFNNILVISWRSVLLVE